MVLCSFVASKILDPFHKKEQCSMRAISGFFAMLLISTLPLFAQPKLEVVGGNIVNWGTVTSKQNPLKSKVKIVNAGNEELRISKVKPACGCTATLLDKDVLQPGDTATIDVSLNITGRHGSVTKTVSISSNDPNHPTTILYLKAVVNDPITVSPQYFAFGQIEVGKEAKAEVSVKNNSKQDITLSNFKTTGGITLDVPEKVVVKAGSTVKLIAKVTPEKTGYWNGAVNFSTDHPDFPSFQIMAYGQVKKSEAAESPVFVQPKK